MATDEKMESRPTLKLKQRTFPPAYVLTNLQILLPESYHNKFKHENFEDLFSVKKWMTLALN